MGTPPRELDTRAEPFATNPLALVAAPEHPLVDLPQVPTDLLSNEVFLIREPGSGTRASMEVFLKERRIHPAMIVEMSSNETIKQSVMANMGVSFLSMHTMGMELSAGVIKMLDVEGLPLLRRWHVVNMRAKLLSPAAEAFRYFLHHDDFFAQMRSFWNLQFDGIFAYVGVLGSELFIAGDG